MAHNPLNVSKQTRADREYDLAHAIAVANPDLNLIGRSSLFHAAGEARH